FETIPCDGEGPEPMNVLLAVVLSVALGSATRTPPAPQAGDKKEKATARGPEGYWLGRIKFIGINLPLGIHLTRTRDGALTGTMDSPDEGIFKLPLDRVTFKGGALAFDVKLSKATFEGRLKEDNSELAGTWKQSGLKLPLTFKSEPKVPVFT